MIKRLLNYIWDTLIIWSPLHWVQIHPYSAEWDKKFNELLDNNSFEHINDYTAYLGGYSIWIGNYPSGGFTIREGTRDHTEIHQRAHFCHNEVDEDGMHLRIPVVQTEEEEELFKKVRPSRRTILKAHRQLLQDRFIALI